MPRHNDAGHGKNEGAGGLRVALKICAWIAEMVCIGKSSGIVCGLFLVVIEGGLFLHQ